MSHPSPTNNKTGERDSEKTRPSEPILPGQLEADLWQTLVNHAEEPSELADGILKTFQVEGFVYDISILIANAVREAEERVAEDLITRFEDSLDTEYVGYEAAIATAQNNLVDMKNEYFPHPKGAEK